MPKGLFYRRQAAREAPGYVYCCRTTVMNCNEVRRILVLLLLAPAIAQAQTSPLRVNGQRLMQHLNELAQFGKNPQGGVSRVAYTQADLQGRDYAMGLMRAARLEVTIDAAGNIVGSRTGS